MKFLLCRLAFILVLMGTVSACGQKGKLVMPVRPTPISTPYPVASPKPAAQESTDEKTTESDNSSVKTPPNVDTHGAPDKN